MISRRQLLTGAVGAAVLSVLLSIRQSVGTVVDVGEFGATGDGDTDDSQAIQAAVAALRSGDTLYFPSGTYRFAQHWPAGDAAVVITGVSDVAIVFDRGAELFMDNLDSALNTGTGHAVLIHGPATRIALHNMNIRWAAGAQRSLGDGIRVVGAPVVGSATPAGWIGPVTPVARVDIVDCTVRGSPQAGTIVIGASDVTVTGLRVADSLADGLHINACRRVRIEDYGAVNTGDDGLALVTYFAPEFSFDNAAETFAFPTLTDWSNADIDIADVSVVDGMANGIRIAGAHRVAVRHLRVTGVQSGSAVMVDSAEPGSSVGWNYLASQSVSIDDMRASNCDTGLHVLARPHDSRDGRFTEFGIEVGAAEFENCHNWAVRAESLAEHKVSGLRIDRCRVASVSVRGGNGGIGLGNAERISFGDVVIHHAEPVVSFSAQDVGRLAVDRLRMTVTTPQHPPGSAPPSMSLNRVDGMLDDVELGWSAAPGRRRARPLS